MIEERERGILAIIGLQAIAGIDEPRERAEANWDMFSEWEKRNTLAAWEILKPGGEDEIDLQRHAQRSPKG